jgi:hypothetical protein
LVAFGRQHLLSAACPLLLPLTLLQAFVPASLVLPLPLLSALLPLALLLVTCPCLLQQQGCVQRPAACSGADRSATQNWHPLFFHPQLIPSSHETIDTAIVLLQCRRQRQQSLQLCGKYSFDH